MAVSDQLQWVKLRDEYKIYGQNTPEHTYKNVPEALLSTVVPLVFTQDIPLQLLKNQALCERVKQIQGENIPYFFPGQVWNVAQTIEVAKRHLWMGQGGIYLFRSWPCFVNGRLFKNRSIIADTIKNVFFLFLSKNAEDFQDGTYKKVRLALILPFNSSETAGQIVRLSNKKFLDRAGLDTQTTNGWFDSFFKEVQTSLQYSCTLKPLVTFIRWSSNTETGKMYLLEERLQTLLDFPVVDSSDEEWYQCTLSLIDGLLEMHSDGRIHGDIKSTNVLWCREQGKIVCKWIDFGFSQRFSSEGTKAPLLRNWYGSIDCTPPELLGWELTTPKELFAAETWALGYLLGTLLFGKLMWSDMLLEAYKNEKVFSEDIRKSILEEMSSYLRFLFNQAIGQPLSVFSRIRLLCLALMDLDPKARITLKQAKEYLEACPRPIERSASR